MTDSGSGWIETTLFKQYVDNNGGYPSGGVILDASGNLYGTNGLFWEPATVVWLMNCRLLERELDLHLAA